MGAQLAGVRAPNNGKWLLSWAMGARLAGFRAPDNGKWLLSWAMGARLAGLRAPDNGFWCPWTLPGPIVEIPDPYFGSSGATAQ